MALSIVSIPGDGVTDTFNVSFALGILDRTSVTAWVTGEVDGGGNKVYRTITYLTDTMLKISGAKAGVGVMVVFTRTVSQTNLVVNYEDGDIMNEVNLNTSQKQALMLVHQVLDGRFSAFIQNVSAGGFKITNLGTPTVGTDAATKAYVDSVVATGASNAAAAAASAAAALASQNAAAASAGAAATSEANSLTYSNNSSTFATNSSNSATASAGSATASQTSRLASEAARDKAQEWSDKPEDTFVTGTTEYSAYHWSRKALGYVTGNIGNAIHGATDKTTLVDADEIGVADSAAAWVLKRWTFANLKTQIGTYIIGLFNTTVDTTPLDADRLWTGDSTASFNPIYTTWTNVKVFLKTYFDTLYAAASHTHTFASLTSKPTTVAGYGITNVVFDQEFVSAQQIITNNGLLTIAHGLGVVPKFLYVQAICITADIGYGVGDVMQVGPFMASASNEMRGLSVVMDATNIITRIGASLSGFHRTTATQAAPTSANWKLIFKAYA